MSYKERITNMFLPKNLKHSNYLEETTGIKGKDLNDIRILFDKERIQDAENRRKLIRNKTLKNVRKVLTSEEKRKRLLNKTRNEIKKEEVKTNVTEKSNSFSYIGDIIGNILMELLMQIF